jgi:hypothetical protein
MVLPKNTIVKSVCRSAVFDDVQPLIDATVSFNQGDFLILDTTNHLIAKPSAETDGATFLGVAVETIALGKLKKPYSTDVDAATAISAVAGPVHGVEAQAVLKTGSTLTVGGLVYLDPATATNGVAATGTKAIGVYTGAQGAISGSAAGLVINVKIGHRFPGDSLVVL